MKTTTENSSQLATQDPCGAMQAAFRLNIVYWVCMFLADSLLGYFINIDPLESAPLKVVLFGISAMMTYLMASLLFRLRHQLSFLLKALLCFLMSAVAAPIYTTLDFINYVICQYPKPVAFDPTYSGYTLIEAAAMMFGWSCLFVAVLDNFEVVERERQLAEVRREALNAQMQALRYQINPHFLFNTLNSIAGLIEEGASTRAERMVLALSNFMRKTLALDPMQDVTLGAEIALQEEYLAIERERFSDRMTFMIDVPLEIFNARVPSLILQPLIENAVKHGVGASSTRVDITLKAYREDNRLYLIVENDIPPAGMTKHQPIGMQVGLQNVAKRLAAHFQTEGHFTAGEVAEQRYRATINIPWSVI